MALSVLKPEAAIHPVVGSIFSAPNPPDSFESFAEVENLATGDRREFLRAALSTTANSSPSMSGAHLVPRDTEETQPASPAASIPSGAVPADRFLRHPDTVRSASVKPDGLVPDNSRANLSEKVPAHDANPVGRKFTPFMPAVLTQSPQPVTMRSTSKPSDDATQSFGSRSRASDDIEIHIGRIEVAAIQAPSIRPAPAKTLRRAASLDEYLKRRDGITS